MENNNDADRRLLLALFLSLGVLYAWSQWFSPRTPAQPPVTAEVQVESGATTGAATPTANPVAGAEPGAIPTGAVPADAEPGSDDPAIEVEPPIPDRVVELASADVDAKLSSQDGAIHSIALKKWKAEPTVTPIWRWIFDKVGGADNGSWLPYVGGDQRQSLMSDEGAVGLVGAGTPSAMSGWRVETEGDTQVLTRTLPNGVAITKRVRPGELPYTFKMEITFENKGSAPVSDLWVGVVEKAHKMTGRFDNALMPLGYTDGDLEHLEDPEDAVGAARTEHEGPVSWMGLGSRYFLLALLPDESPADKLVFDDLPDGRVGAFIVDTRALAPGEARTRVLTTYAGPKSLDSLEPLGGHLDASVEFGFFGFFSKILLSLLKLIHSVAVNWGLSIILLTVLVKTVFFPLTQASMVSGRRMQAVQPQLTALREKHKDDQMKLNTEMMALFKENNVNPMGGCLPMVIQMPVWFALYSVLLYSVELYDSRFLYLRDLTAADPYAVLPTIVAVLFYVQQLLTPMTNMDPTQQKMMRYMPLIFAVFMYSLPSGLVLYITVNSILSIAQMWVINRRIPAATTTT